MKQLLISMLLCLTTLTAAAQAPTQGNINEKVLDAKVRELVYRMHITDEQKAKFVPIYRRYNDEMRATWGEHAKGPKGKKGDKDKKDGKGQQGVKPQKPQKPATGKEAAELQKRKMERQQRAQAVRMKYIDELGAVLNADQVSRFFEVESKIQKKLMERKKNPRGKHGKTSRAGKPGKGGKHPQRRPKPQAAQVS